MRIVAISVGRPQVLVRGGRQYSTSINRRVVEGVVRASKEGLEGDIIGDQRVHGGPDKAICCYCREHYEYWGPILGGDLRVPSFGENFTVEGALETDVALGDVFERGALKVQVTQPRQPCWKLANKHDEPRLIAWVNERAYCGFYLRVLSEGEARAGDELTRTARPHANLTIERMLRARLSEDIDRVMVKRLVDAAEISESWRGDLKKKLKGRDGS